MSDDPVRKFVKPAHPDASIPDPAHGRNLPPEGMEVVWDHYWIGRERSGDIIVSDVVDEPTPTPKEGNKVGDAPKADALKSSEICKSTKG